MPGSYNCTCHTGFVQNYSLCEGMSLVYVPLTPPVLTCLEVTTAPAIPALYRTTVYVKVYNASCICPANSACSNMPGSYNCTCHTGFVQNNSLCEGMYLVYVPLTPPALTCLEITAAPDIPALYRTTVCVKVCL